MSYVLDEFISTQPYRFVCMKSKNVSKTLPLVSRIHYAAAPSKFRAHVLLVSRSQNLRKTLFNTGA